MKALKRVFLESLLAIPPPVLSSHPHVPVIPQLDAIIQEGHSAMLVQLNYHSRLVKHLHRHYCNVPD